MYQDMAEWCIDLPDEAATLAFAARFAAELRAGDLLTLNGELGVGKTSFARAMIQTLMLDSQLEVPSPSFSLLQHYETPHFSILHADFYRIKDQEELEAIGWHELSEKALVLCEWAVNAADFMQRERFDANFEFISEKARRLTLKGYGACAQRLLRAQAIDRLLQGAGLLRPLRSVMQGDASTRLYERVLDLKTASHAILMIAPARPDGPPIRWGKSYSKLAHLAENIEPFVALARALRQQGFSAPEIYAADFEHGLILLEDLGSLGVVEPVGSRPIPLPERYALATDLLANLHNLSLPEEIPLVGERNYTIPPYDLDAMLIEVELLLDWFFPYRTGRQVNASQRMTFIDSWSSILRPLTTGEKTWVLRDYHSPNLLFLPERRGIERIGLIDFQDCVIGSPAYDLASLLQDARVDVPETLEIQLLTRYIQQRNEGNPHFDHALFGAHYALLGAQRASKILGIFVRLDQRDGKKAYLEHIPRIEMYLKRCLQHPMLAPLSQWYLTHLPVLFMPQE